MQPPIGQSGDGTSMQIGLAELAAACAAVEAHPAMAAARFISSIVGPPGISPDPVIPTPGTVAGPFLGPSGHVSAVPVVGNTATGYIPRPAQGHSSKHESLTIGLRSDLRPSCGPPEFLVGTF